MADGWDYVALAVIDHNGVRAYNPGDQVHADNVKEYGYLEAGLVELIDAKPKRGKAEPADSGAV
jgi:hypothetical protein